MQIALLHELHFSAVFLSVVRGHMLHLARLRAPPSGARPANGGGIGSGWGAFCRGCSMAGVGAGARVSVGARFRLRIRVRVRVTQLG